MPEITIGDRPVGPDKPTYIIAEAGSNHDQSRKQASELIQAAAGAGADAVKFQLFDADVLYPEGGEAQETLSDLELPRDWLPGLKKEANANGIDFFASPFDTHAIEALVQSGVPALKIASSEVTNHKLLQAAASAELPIIASTAMSNLADVQEAVHILTNNGGKDLALLQCTALYPCAPEHVHLRAMDTLSQAFDTVVGFSDHTLGTWAPVAAVARGASIVEKHFTLDKELEGPDHHYALEPAKLAQMVEDIRRTEEALGSSDKVLLSAEAEHARREGIHATEDLRAGQTLEDRHVQAARSVEGAIPARYRESIPGRTLSKDVDEGDPIGWGALEPVGPGLGSDAEPE